MNRLNEKTVFRIGDFAVCVSSAATTALFYAGGSSRVVVTLLGMATLLSGLALLIEKFLPRFIERRQKRQAGQDTGASSPESSG